MFLVFFHGDSLLVELPEEETICDCQVLYERRIDLVNECERGLGGVNTFTQPLLLPVESSSSSSSDKTIMGRNVFFKVFFFIHEFGDVACLNLEMPANGCDVSVRSCAGVTVLDP